MPERRRRPDLDEPFSLHPMEGEDVLEILLETPRTETTHHDGDDEDEPVEDEDS